ncbi:MAG: arginine--tRNA ligase, partial [Candidatus Omnitrophica bacterium]|nr:arginine--tRNA ligase [Candidatus Omnitrophota bacterium]
MNNFYQELSCALKDIVKKNYLVEFDEPLWDWSSKQDFGDLSSPVALRLASQLKRKPMDIAEDIRQGIKECFDGKKKIERVEVLSPGFVNIFFSKELLVSSLNSLIDNGDSFFCKNYSKKVLIEFVSANPTGPLSIAHGRQAVVGDTIANILAFCGNDVKREYY